MPAKSKPSPVLDKPRKSPAISGPIQAGGQLKSSDLKGSWVVLYFYPKDMTPGCTQESEDFQAKKQSFTKAGAKIIGVSKDSVSRHEKFAEKHGLTFDLISDAEGDLCEKFEVWKEKKLYGRSFMGIERSTFLLNPKGEVVAEWRKVKVTGHVDEVLSTLKSLQSPG